MLFSVWSLLLASAAAVPAITQAGPSSDCLTVQISLDHTPEPTDSRCEQLCNEREVFCEAGCTTEECKKVCIYEDDLCKMKCKWTPPSPPKDEKGNEYCVPTCLEGHYLCINAEKLPRIECDFEYWVCRAKCKVEDD
ncbi:hypothetical protein CLAIMM_04260 [Cladophialophora immunda]|nr:hypothetical protein CLAIMM_04260 [Cladophialophora immunda]